MAQLESDHQSSETFQLPTEVPLKIIRGHDGTPMANHQEIIRFMGLYPGAEFETVDRGEEGLYMVLKSSQHGGSDDDYVI